MDKLIGLLNEFCREKRGDYVVVRYREKEHSFDTFSNGAVDYMTDLYVVSKRCGFIQRLIENDKIDLRKLDYKISDVDIPTRYYLGTYIRYSIENEILMSLAIQDNPIQNLIDLLK